MNSRKMFLGGFLLIIFTVSYLHSKDPEHVFRDEIKFNAISHLKMKVHFPAGELTIKGHDEPGFKTKCTYSDKLWQPELLYERKNEEGRLLMEMPAFDSPMNLDDDEFNWWEVSLDRDIPVYLRVNLGAGTGHFDLEGMKIREFDFSLTGGEVHLNLRNTSIPDLDFKALAGEAKVDLSGKWENDLKADFTCGFGEMTLILPSETAVRVKINGVLGEVHAPDFDHDGEYFVNRAGNTEHLLDISLTGGIGEVHLKLTDD